MPCHRTTLRRSASPSSMPPVARNLASSRQPSCPKPPLTLPASRSWCGRPPANSSPSSTTAPPPSRSGVTRPSPPDAAFPPQRPSGGEHSVRVWYAPHVGSAQIILMRRSHESPLAPPLPVGEGGSPTGAWLGGEIQRRGV